MLFPLVIFKADLDEGLFHYNEQVGIASPKGLVCIVPLDACNKQSVDKMINYQLCTTFEATEVFYCSMEGSMIDFEYGLIDTSYSMV